MRGKKLIKNLLVLGLIFSTWGIFGFHSGDLEKGRSQNRAGIENIIQDISPEKENIVNIERPQYSQYTIENPDIIEKPQYSIVAEVSTAKQTMTVRRDGEVIHVWKISTGRAGYRTPGGKYRPQRMHTMWHSRLYNNAPMPYAIFFYNGYAIHGTTAIGRLGSPASHGCVRLATENAKKLFSLVTAAGVNKTQIIVLN